MQVRDTGRPGSKYDGPTIALHWLVAFLVTGLWTVGQTVEWLPKGPLRGAIWSTHVVAGFGLAVILIARLVWRRTSGRHLPAVGGPAVRTIAVAVHVGLYVLLLVVVALGIANAFDRGFGLYGILKLPQIGDPALKHQLTEWHGLTANLLMGLALVHAAAALAHHYVWRDDVLRRMMPGRSRAV